MTDWSRVAWAQPPPPASAAPASTPGGRAVAGADGAGRIGHRVAEEGSHAPLRHRRWCCRRGRGRRRPAAVGGAGVADHGCRWRGRRPRCRRCPTAAGGRASRAAGARAAAAAAPAAAAATAGAAATPGATDAIGWVGVLTAGGRGQHQRANGEAKQTLRNETGHQIGSLNRVNCRAGLNRRRRAHGRAGSQISASA